MILNFIKVTNGKYIVDVTDYLPEVDVIVNGLGRANEAISPLMDEETVLAIVQRKIAVDFINVKEAKKGFAAEIVFTINDNNYTISISDKIADSAGGIIYGLIK